MIGVLRRFGSLLWRALRHFSEDHGPNHAAAVAYFSLLSFPPVALLTGRAIHLVLPGGGGTDAALAAIASFLPGEVAPYVLGLGKGLAHGGAFVAVAIPALVWVASHAFSSLEVAVNVAFGTTPQRRFLLSRLKAFAGLSGGVLVLGGTLAAEHVAVWLDHYRAVYGGPRFLSPRAHVVSVAGLLLVTFCVFTLFYKALPRGRVAWGVAARAAMVAVLLWEGSRRLFGALLLQSPAFGLLQGALAGVVAVLGWIYVAVVVTIYGAEVAAILNGNRP